MLTSGMTKDELFAQIQKTDLIPVPVIFSNDEADLATEFDGTLEQFLVAAKAIGSKAIFVQDHLLYEEDFYHSPEESEDEDEKLEIKGIDLAIMSRALAKFKKILGQNHSFSLITKGGIEDLEFVVFQDWVGDFENEREKAEEKLLSDPSEAQNN